MNKESKSKNDLRILELKSIIERKREELKKKPTRFNPITNCILTIDGTSFNIHTCCETNMFILIRLNSWIMSAEHLNIDPNTIKISGFTLNEWKQDITNYLEVQSYKTEKKMLEKFEQQLNNLLSEETQTELQLDAIAEELNNTNL